ncbi:MAG: sigma 54-interacting transcriptional regulator [Brevibacillus sp.]|nr:sigma 54-interacting transcriptional regulator [Brevibacillus sp.]
MFITDHTGTVLYANKQTESLYLVPREYLVGKTVEELERNRIFNPSITKQVLIEKKKKTIIQETKIGKKVLVTATPVFDEVGQIKYVISYSHDVTELIHLRQYVTEMEKEMKKVRNELHDLRFHKHMDDGVIASSLSMKKVTSFAKRIARFDIPVLITGASGVGKTTIAKFIHHHSERAAKPVVEISCSELPEALLDIELFGMADSSDDDPLSTKKPGMLHELDGGTLILDKIEHLPDSLQVKLLNLLRDRKFVPVGGNTPVDTNVRLIVTTSADLEKKVQAGDFRQDLYSRLSVAPIHIASLQERPEDIYVMLMEFNNRFNVQYQQNKRFQQRAIDQLVKYRWPGNVRELEDLVERMILTTDVQMIGIEHLPDKVVDDNESIDMSKKTLTELLEEFEAKIIKNAYMKTKSTTKLAEELGISQPTATRKLQKYKHLLEE